MEHHELGERAPEQPRAPGQQPPHDRELERDDVAARGDEPLAREEPDRAVEARARDPLPVQLQRAGPEVEQADQHGQRGALARREQEGARHPERHAVLVAPQPEVEREEGQLDEHEQAEAGVRAPRPAPPREGHGNGQAARGPEHRRQLEPVDRQHAQPLAVRQQRPADRLGAGREEAELVALPDPERREHVQQRQHRAVGAERGVGGDLLRLTSQEAGGARHP